MRTLPVQVGAFVACRRVGNNRRLDSKGRAIQGVVVGIRPVPVDEETGEMHPDFITIVSAFGAGDEIKTHAFPADCIDPDQTDPPLPMHVEEVTRRLLIASRYREARQLLISIEGYSK